MKPNAERFLLSAVRNGDYAHPGGEEALVPFLREIQKITQLNSNAYLLDVGSGLGGTLDFFWRHGVNNLQGIDINPGQVNYSKKKYPHITFTTLSANDLASHFSENEFSIITCLNVLYAIEEKSLVFEKIFHITKPGGIFLFSDYCFPRGVDSLETKDFSGNIMRPLNLEKTLVDLENSGWRTQKSEDISDLYKKWYQEFIEALSDRALENEFSLEIIQRVQSAFESLLQKIENGKLGGVFFVAEKL